MGASFQIAEVLLDLIHSIHANSGNIFLLLLQELLLPGCSSDEMKEGKGEG